MKSQRFQEILFNSDLCFKSIKTLFLQSKEFFQIEFRRK